MTVVLKVKVSILELMHRFFEGKHGYTASFYMQLKYSVSKPRKRGLSKYIKCFTEYLVCCFSQFLSLVCRHILSRT